MRNVNNYFTSSSKSLEKHCENENIITSNSELYLPYIHNNQSSYFANITKSPENNKDKYNDRISKSNNFNNLYALTSNK